MSTLHDHLGDEGSRYEYVDVLFVDLANDTINRILARLAIPINERIGVTVKIVRCELLLVG